MMKNSMHFKLVNRPLWICRNLTSTCPTAKTRQFSKILSDFIYRYMLKLIKLHLQIVVTATPFIFLVSRYLILGTNHFLVIINRKLVEVHCSICATGTGTAQFFVSLVPQLNCKCFKFFA